MRRPSHHISLAMAACLGLLLLGCGTEHTNFSGPISDWPTIGGNPEAQRFSILNQITPDNVGDLEVAWTYHTGDVSAGTDIHGATTFEATPIVVNDTMYFCTGYNRVIALDPETGQERWTYDPQVDLTGVYTPTCRGVAFWQERTTAAQAKACGKRIVSATLDARLFTVDAESGEPCGEFGEAGFVDLKANLGDLRLAEYYVTSAPLVINDLVVTNAFVKDGQRVDSPPGVIRAFDIRTGELRWAFDPVPPSMDGVTAEDALAGKNFTRGTAASWGNMSADVENGLIFLPMGGAQPDHYGGTERGQKDYFGTSVVTLDADTGMPVWHFQAVHHDIWDYDIAAQPVLFEHRGSRSGVITATKTGHIFLLDRTTGAPLFPVEERPVPKTFVEGEYTSPTQPFPTLPKPIHPQTLTEDDIWGLYPGDREACLQHFREMDYRGIFTPPAFNKATLQWPGLGGGVNWGSVSVNVRERIMIANTMRVPYTIKLIPRENAVELDGTDLVGANAQEGTPYVVIRGGFVSPNNTPCTAPPWGVLTAVDLDTGETLWEEPLGNLEELSPLGLGRVLDWGTPNTGGSLQTDTGLVFIGATLDGYFRAFDVHTGETLWEEKLPAPAQASPMTYRLNKDSKQYVVIAAGGHGPLAYAAKGPDKLGELLGDALVAFRLPD